MKNKKKNFLFPLSKLFDERSVKLMYHISMFRAKNVPKLSISIVNYESKLFDLISKLFFACFFFFVNLWNSACNMKLFLFFAGTNLIYTFTAWKFLPKIEMLRGYKLKLKEWNKKLKRKFNLKFRLKEWERNNKIFSFGKWRTSLH